MPQWAPTSGKTLLINIVPSGKIHSKSVSTVKMRIPTKINSNANTPSYKIGSPVKIHLNVEWNDCSQVSKHFGFPVDILVSPFVPPFIWTFWFPRLYHHSSSYFSFHMCFNTSTTHKIYLSTMKNHKSFGRWKSEKRLHSKLPVAMVSIEIFITGFK